MPIIDDRTSNQNYPLPNLANNLADDVLRLRDAFSGIDADIAAVAALVATKAALSHQHAFVDIPGLQTALDGKAAIGHSHALDDLSDVDSAAAANNQYLKRSGALWIPATVQISDVQGLQTALENPTSHTHDDRYYTETEIDGFLAARDSAISGKANTGTTITAGSGLTGGGDLSANRTVNVGQGAGIVVSADDIAIDKASVANVRAATLNKVLTADAIEGASAAVALADAATIAVDWDSFIYGQVILSANRVLGNAINVQPGTWRVIEIAGNDGTARTLTFGSEYTGDLPTLNDISSTKKYLLMLFGRQSSPSRVLLTAVPSLV